MPLADTLLRLAEGGLYRPIWSQIILDELERNLILKWNKTPQQAARRLLRMNSAFGEALVTGFHEAIPLMPNDKDDRHVAAVAYSVADSIILTFNLNHFKTEGLDELGVKAIHPSVFLRNIYMAQPETVARILLEQQAENLSLANESLLARLQNNVADFVEFLSQDSAWQAAVTRVR